jgi:hypothetical protein
VRTSYAKPGIGRLDTVQENNATSDGKRELLDEGRKLPPIGPTKEEVISYRREILRRIEDDPLAHRFLLKLTVKYQFNADEIIGGLLDNIFHDRLGRRERLLASPTLPESVRKHMQYLSPGEWKEKNPSPDLSVAARARDLAEAIEKAETDTPLFGMNELERFKSSTESERELAVQELNKLPATLRLYADYFEKSRRLWRIMGRIELDAQSEFQKAVRDLLQEQIRTRTGHYSDDRYYRLLNIARNVVGQPEIERNALTMRRVRRGTPRKNR